MSINLQQAKQINSKQNSKINPIKFLNKPKTAREIKDARILRENLALVNTKTKITNTPNNSPATTTQTKSGGCGCHRPSSR